MWYSAPPDGDSYHNDIIKIFLGLFQKHIPETFGILREDLTDPQRHTTQYILAMAAVGGLYCTVTGSSDVAKSMYNDARRLQFASVGSLFRRCFLILICFQFNTSVDSTTTAGDRLETIKTVQCIPCYARNS